MGELKPKGGHGSGAGQLHLVRHTTGLTTKKTLRQEVVSFMPKTSGVEKRQDVKRAMSDYLSKAVEFMSNAIKTMKEDPLFADDLPIPIALEWYIMEKMRECQKVINQSADSSLMNEFIKFASTITFYSRMVYLADDAKLNFENIAPELKALCDRCGVENLGTDTERVLKEYLPLVKKLSER